MYVNTLDFFTWWRIMPLFNLGFSLSLRYCVSFTPHYCITVVVWETKYHASIEQDVNTTVFRGLEVC
jgi:hypothetical protein